MEVSLKKSRVSLSGEGHTSSYLASLSANITLRHSFIDYNTIQKNIPYGVATKIDPDVSKYLSSKEVRERYKERINS